VGGFKRGNEMYITITILGAAVIGTASYLLLRDDKGELDLQFED